MAELKKVKTTEEILKEMEAMSQSIDTSDVGSKQPPSSTAPAKNEGGGALKSLLGFFIKVHDEEADKPSTPPAIAQLAKVPNAPVPTATPTTPNPAATTSDKTAARRVGELVMDEPVPKFTPPATNKGAALSEKPFVDIYREAGLAKATTPVEELATLLENPTVANQPLAIKVVAVNLALTAKGAKLEDYIADAVRKDRALDAYQKMLNERAHEVEVKTKAETEHIQKEVEEYLKKKQAEMENLRTQAAEATRQSIEFSVRRQTEEQRLANIVSPFLEGKPNPVTVGNTPDEI